MSNRDVGVVIGIGRYHNFTDLTGAMDDAADMCAWLRGPGQFRHVECVMSEDSDERPAYGEIDEAIGKVINLAEAEANRLWVYFTGHGSAAALRHVMVLMADCSAFYSGRAINGAAYQEVIAKFSKFREQIFLYDCCRSHDGRHLGLGPTFSAPSEAPAGGGSVVQIVGYSSHWQDESYEDEMGEQVRGLFTRALLAGLNGRAARRGPAGWEVTWESLSAFVKDRVREDSKDMGGQEPVFEVPDDARSVVICEVASPPAPATITVRTPRETTVIVIDSNQLQYRYKLESGARSFRVDPGKYTLSTLPRGLAPSPNAFQVWADEETVIEMTE